MAPRTAAWWRSPRTRALGAGAGMLALATGALAQTVVEGLRPEAEFDVAEPVLSGASGEQTVPRAAWDGTQFLVTWRSSFWKDEFRATRLSASGQVLDGRGLRVAGRDRNDGTAPLAAGGGGFLIAYVADPARVMVTRASGQGPRLTIGEAAVLFDGGTDFSTSEPAVAFADPSFWVLWARQSPTPTVVAARVDAAGKPRDTTPLELGPGYGAVAVAGDAGAAWGLWGVPQTPAPAPPRVQLRLARLAETAPLVSPTGGTLLLDLPGKTVTQVALAVGGGQRLAVAAVTDASGTDSVLFTRFSPEGQPLDAGKAALISGARLQGGPSALWNGQSFLISFSTQVEISGRPTPRLHSFAVDAAGNASALPAPAASLAGRQPTLVAGGAGSVTLLWEEVIRLNGAGDPANTDILAQPFPPGAAGPPTVVSLAPSWHSEPALAWNGRQALVAFEDGREDTAQIDVYAARVSADGKGLDQGGLPLGTGPGLQHAPVVAWDGQNFVVAWHEGQAGLAVTRISEQGQVLDRPAQRLAGSAGKQLLSEPAICGTGQGALLAWAVGTGTEGQAELRALHLHPDQRADAVGAPTALLARTADLVAPVLRLGCRPDSALLVWSGKLASAPAEPPSLNYLHFKPDGQSLDPLPAITTLAPRITEEWSGIGHDDERGVFMVGWRSFNERGQRTVYAGRIDDSGRLLDPLPGIAVGQSNSGRRVTTLWDGRQWVVMAVNTAGGNPFELRARRLSPAGEVLDPNWITVSVISKPWGGGGAGAEGVVVAPGRALLVYEQYPEDDASSNPRARARFVDMPVRGPDYQGPVSGSEPQNDAGSSDAAPAAGHRAQGGGCHCALAGSAPGPRPPGLAVAAAALLLGAGLRRRRSRTRTRRSAGKAPPPAPPTAP